MICRVKTLLFLIPIEGRRINTVIFPDIVAENIKSCRQFKPKDQLTNDLKNAKGVHIRLMDFYAGGKMEVACEFFCKHLIFPKASEYTQNPSLSLLF